MGACGAGLALGQSPLKPAPPVVPEVAELPAGSIPKQEPGDGTYAGRPWKLQHQVDEEDLSVLMNDLKFMSAERGIALCSMQRQGEAGIAGAVDARRRPALDAVEIERPADFPGVHAE